jgi:RHS repeat-associated protein
MDSVCDVNLNARVYDPTIGRFLSPDSVTETAYDLQVLNRYSYVGNNPLSYTDPSGHCFLGCFWSSGIFRAVVAIVAAATLQAELADVELAASTTAELSPQLAVLNAGISGGVSGYITTGRLNGALLGSLEGVAFAGVHFAKSDLGVDTGTVGGALTSAGMHASVGGLFSMAGGGKFGSGFLAAGFSDLAGSASGDDDPGVNALDLSRHAIVGGVGSLLGGGKFANGAVTGAFGYLYNDKETFWGDVKEWFLEDWTGGFGQIPDDLESLARTFRRDPLQGLADVGNGMGGEIPVGTEFTTLSRSALVLDTADKIGVLRTASSGVGNFGLGSASIDEAMALGRAWVGPSYRISSNGRAFISADGLRQFRPPEFKPMLDLLQANFERLNQLGKIIGNGHLTIH